MKVRLFKFLFAILRILGIGNRDWFFAVNQNGEEPIFLRARKKPPSGKKVGEFTHLAKVSWTYSDDGNGLPSDEEEDAMGSFEDKLDESIEGLQIGFMMLIRTSNSKREWYWYVRDKGEFQREYETCLPGNKASSVVCEFEFEPDWKSWKKAISELRR